MSAFFSTRVFTTPVVTAIFPNLNNVDNYGKYGLEMEATPDLRAAIDGQLEAFFAAAHAKHPNTFDFSAHGTLVKTKTSKKSGETREVFVAKMNPTKKVKGTEVPQKPMLVDAMRNPVTELVYGGSQLKVACHIQAFHNGNETFVSLKLDGAQVIEHVGPGGVSANSLFDEVEGGFTSEGTDAAVADGTPDAPTTEAPANGAAGHDF